MEWHWTVPEMNPVCFLSDMEWSGLDCSQLLLDPTARRYRTARGEGAASISSHPILTAQVRDQTYQGDDQRASHVPGGYDSPEAGAHHLPQEQLTGPPY